MAISRERGALVECVCKGKEVGRVPYWEQVQYVLTISCSSVCGSVGVCLCVLCAPVHLCIHVVCVCVCVCVCMRACVRACAHVYQCTFHSVYAYEYACVLMLIC